MPINKAALKALRDAGFSLSAARDILSRPTLRDQIAMEAMKALLGRSFSETSFGNPSAPMDPVTPDGLTVASVVATESYIMADAMLRAALLPEHLQPTDFKR